MDGGKYVLFCSLSWLGLASMVQAQDEVRVLSVLSVPMSKYGMSWQSTQARVRVKNLAYDKTLQMVFTDREGVTVTQDASYIGPADAGYEIWESWTNLRTGQPYTMRVHYAVADQDFSVGDYAVKQGPVLYAGQNVQQVLGSRQFSGSYANFVVAVRNLAWRKKVLAHYSCDRFLSEQTLELSFQPQFMYGYGYVSSPTEEGYEMWSGTLTTVPASCGVLQYYYTYEVNDQTFADTNFGQNYIMGRY